MPNITTIEQVEFPLYFKLYDERNNSTWLVAYASANERIQISVRSKVYLHNIVEDRGDFSKQILSDLRSANMGLYGDIEFSNLEELEKHMEDYLEQTKRRFQQAEDNKHSSKHQVLEEDEIFDQVFTDEEYIAADMENNLFHLIN